MKPVPPRLLLNLMTCCVLWFGGACVWAAQPHCQGDCVPIGKWQVQLNFGYGLRTNPVIQQDDVTYTVFPKITYYGKRFFLDSYDVGYTLYDRGHHQFNAILITPSFEQTFFNDANLSNRDIGDQGAPDAAAIALHERDIAGLSGFEYTYIAQHFDWQTQFLQDVTGVHKGQKIRSALTFPFQRHRDYFELNTGIIWQSSKLIDYYYGVGEDQLFDDTLAYHAKASTALFIKGEWERRLNKHWGIRAVASYKWLGKSVTDSPLVNTSGTATGYIAGVYHFQF